MHTSGMYNIMATCPYLILDICVAKVTSALCAADIQHV